MTFESAGKPQNDYPHPEATLTDTELRDAYAQIYAENSTLRAEVETLRPLAYTDELTGLKNRHALVRSFEEFADSNTPFGLLFVDITNFKRVNDRYSHEAGDNALRMTAHHLAHAIPNDLSNSFRADDVVASRRGGDEFAVLIRHAPRGPEGEELTIEDTLDVISKRYQSSFLELDEVMAYNAEASRDEQIGLRIGHAAYDDGMSLKALIALADPKGSATEQDTQPTFKSLLLGDRANAGIRTGWRLARAGRAAIRSVLDRS